MLLPGNPELLSGFARPGSVQRGVGGVALAKGNRGRCEKKEIENKYFRMKEMIGGGGGGANPGRFLV